MTAVAATEPVASTPVGTRQDALDGLRGLAALAVLLTHVGFLTGTVTDGLLGAVLGRFDLGVAVFFALSGYLLHGGFVQARAAGGPAPSTRSYLIRRAARVLPLYWLVLLVVVVWVRPDAAAVAVHVALAQVYVPGVLLDEFSQTWSLATEVAFYAVLPLLAALVGRAARPHRAVLLLVALGWVAAALCGGFEIGGEALGPRWLPAHLSWFAAGMLVAESRAAPTATWAAPLRELAARPGTCLALAGAAFLLATTAVAGPLTLGTVTGPQALAKEVLGAVVAVALLLPLALGDPRGSLARTLGSPLGRYLGRVSYGVFLWHLPVLTGFYAATGIEPFSGHLALMVIAVVPVSLGLATLSFHLIERPLVRWSHRVTRRPGG